MKLRCKDGDLAIIVEDFLGCEENLGVIVKVIGPPTRVKTCNLTCWYVYPITRRKLWVVDPLEKVRVSKTKTVLHPDRLLLPIMRKGNLVCQGEAVQEPSKAAVLPA